MPYTTIKTFDGEVRMQVGLQGYSLPDELLALMQPNVSAEAAAAVNAFTRAYIRQDSLAASMLAPAPAAPADPPLAEFRRASDWDERIARIILPPAFPESPNAAE